MHAHDCVISLPQNVRNAADICEVKGMTRIPVQTIPALYAFCWLFCKPAELHLSLAPSSNICFLVTEWQHLFLSDSTCFLVTEWQHLFLSDSTCFLVTEWQHLFLSDSTCFLVTEWQHLFLSDSTCFLVTEWQHLFLSDSTCFLVTEWQHLFLSDSTCFLINVTITCLLFDLGDDDDNNKMFVKHRPLTNVKIEYHSISLQYRIQI